MQNVLIQICGNFTSHPRNAEDEYNVYQNYYDYEEALKTIKLYRILAINRAEKEKIINVKLTCDVEGINKYLEKNIINGRESMVVPLIQEAYMDAYKRLISGSKSGSLADPPRAGL